MSRLWKDDEELFAMIKDELFTAVVGDIMDKLGYYHQFLPPRIKPLRENMVAVGRAMTVLEADFFQECTVDSKNAISAKPFGLMLEALDDLKPNEVYVCTGSSPHYALWGGLMSTRAIKCGAAGAVLNGYLRDTLEIVALNFPVFSYGAYAQDQGPRGKVVDFRIPIEVGRTRIRPGDVVLGDVDGVCVIPREIEEEAFARALEKARGEQTVRKAIEEGMSAKEAFERFGIM
jgi:regulator of RNase E activity RraA